MTTWLKRLAPVLLILVALVAARALVASREVPQRDSPPVPVPVVEVAELQQGDYPVWLESRGVVEAALEASLVSQVSGLVLEVAEGFTEGGYFRAGEVLLRIDARDYQSAVQIAEAELVQAQLGLAEEQARVAQARRDWDRLQAEDAPSELALRKPQLANAEARITAAGARLAQARLNLERTVLRAPWDGRVRSKAVDLGQFVSAGTVLGQLYASAYAEVRLPLTARQIEQLGPLPEAGRRGSSLPDRGPQVLLLADGRQWTGNIVRSEGTVDPASRQQFVVARVTDPFGLGTSERPPLPVGRFVEARIRGGMLTGVSAIPRIAVREADAVYLLNADDRLQVLQPDVVWRDSSSLYVKGVPDGLRVITSVLTVASPGMQLRVAGDLVSGGSDTPR